MTAGALAKFSVTGMDCAGCASKIETAVGKVAGTSNIKVGLQTETLSVVLDDPAKGPEVEAAVRRLGYEIAPKHDRSSGAPHGDEEAGHDHSDHAKPIEGAWWQSSKGHLVIATGLMIAAGYVEQRLLPYGAHLIFLAACVVGTIPVARRAWAALLSGSLFTIEMLMTIAVAGAIAIGATEEAALVVFLFAVGELLEGVAVGRARSGIRALAQIAPKTAIMETANGNVETPIEAIPIGAIVVARPGDRIPADGTVESGTSSVDESALTGESVPKTKDKGDIVLAGSINTEAVLRIRVEKPAQDTLIARVVKLVEEAADAKAPSERFIDSFSRWYMPAICALAIAVALVPPLVWGEAWGTWIYRALALLLIGCPCALVISTPAAIASALAAGARRGLLVKGGGVLEAVGKVKHIAFDKTGTLTAGKPRVTDVESFGGLAQSELLRIASAAESGSSHPLAVAIVAHAKAEGIAIAPVESQAIPGKGLSAIVDGRRILIGAPARLGVTDAKILARAQTLESDGKSVSAVLADFRPIGLIALRDEPRDDAIQGVREVIALGLRPVMLTGDNRANAEAVGKILGMDVRAELLPEDKLAVVKQLAAEGGIAKVGDGINDAPALAAATVGIAMGSGTDVALEAADAAVLNNRVSDVAALVRLSRRAMAVIKQNVALALGLKAVFLVTTVLGMTGLWIAILADTGATVLVTANALRLLQSRA
ncbi:MAG: heavy metal translocating P-type ATPase [Aestuariivirga sp.]